MPVPFKETRFGRLLLAFRLWNLAYGLREFVYQLLRVDAIRMWVAAIRFFWFVKVRRKLRTLDPGTRDIGVNAVHHNMFGLKKIRRMAVSRSNLLLYPLSALRLSRSAPILSIGPRSEGEILNLMGLGFHNIRALDLISYSPWIQLGDMHAMPYPDDAFAAVIMGWVIAYSDNRPKAAREAVRVARNGGIIAVGVQYNRESAEEISKRVGYDMPAKERLQSVAEILALFQPHVDRVLFSSDLPSPAPEKFDLLVLFSVRK